MVTEKINCPNCDEEMVVGIREFVDVVQDPDYKTQILDGSFFMNHCPSCGDDILIEYPILYMDESKKLNVYLAPDSDEDLLDQLNSLDIPENDLDTSMICRVVDNTASLVEKILLADHGRDDRIIELYKAIVCENVRDQIATITTDDLLYLYENGEEFLVVWSSENEDGEKLTIEIDPLLYDDLEKDYGEVLVIPPNQYAKVDSHWITERIEVEQ